MNKQTLIMLAGLGIGLASCSKDQNKSSPADDPDVPRLTLNTEEDVNIYSQQAAKYTDKMKIDLGLSPEQEKRIQRINAERAYRLQEALGNITNAGDRIEDIEKINRLTYSDYKNVLTDKQYDKFFSMRSEYDEFILVCEDDSIDTKEEEETQVKGYPIQEGEASDNDLDISNYRLNIF